MSVMKTMQSFNDLENRVSQLSNETHSTHITNYSTKRATHYTLFTSTQAHKYTSTQVHKYTTIHIPYIPAEGVAVRGVHGEELVEHHELELRGVGVGGALEAQGAHLCEVVEP